MRKTLNEARLHGIGDPHDDNGDGLGRRLGSLGGRRIHGHNDFDFEAKQIVHEGRKTIASAFCIPHIDDDALPLNVPEPPQLFPKRLQQTGLHVLCENANAMQHLWRLRASFERYGEEANTNQQYSPANHSTTHPSAVGATAAS
jgi:hypothetical protein